MKLSAPRWSSLPQRPQLLHFSNTPFMSCSESLVAMVCSFLLNLCPCQGLSIFSPAGLNPEERPGFFARGSHTRENDKPRERVFILSFPRVAAARGIPFS